VLEDLRRLVEPATMGDPMRPLLWVSKSREKLAVALRTLNHSVCANTVGKMLMTLGYSRQVNRKTQEGSHHPDRDGQFQHQVVGSVRYPKANRVLITADGGGSNGSRVRLWKLESQKLADEAGLTLQVCHYPPGTSKWNSCELDEKSYAKGIKVSDAEMATLNIESDPWHPEWNYTIKPRPLDRSGNS
jgi:hypothetical protein